MGKPWSSGCLLSVVSFSEMYLERFSRLADKSSLRSWNVMIKKLIAKRGINICIFYYFLTMIGVSFFAALF